MSRLPSPGGDNDVWGNILNDFLEVEHNPDGTHRVSVNPDATTSSKGKVQLAGDLAGTAASPTVPGLAAKEPTVASGTTGQYYRGDKSWQTLDKTAVGLANVDNTSDANKPVSSATQTALNAKIAAATATTKGDLLAATAASTIARFGVGTNGQILTANSAAATGLTWSNPASATGAQQVLITVVGDGVTDDGPAIQSALSAVGTAAHSWEFVVEAPPNGTIFINSVVQIETSNTMLRFAAPVLYGDSGKLRIQGEFYETPTTNKPKLTVDSPSGSNTVTLNDVSPFSVGDYVVIRGLRDGTGNSTQRMNNSITGIAGLVLTLAEALDSTYQATYAPGAYQAAFGIPNVSEVTRVTATPISIAPLRGDRTVTVVNSGIFVVGDIVEILDSVNTTSATGVAQVTNYCHRELAEIKQIISGTQIQLSHALHHGYNITKNARVVRVKYVAHSSIKDATVTWNAQGTVANNAFEMRYTVQCTISNCMVTGGTYSWDNQAFRTAESYMSIVENCTARAPAQSGSGQGYGATLYGATYCIVRNCRFVSNRHSVLFFNGSAGNIVDSCISEDVRISDYDFHGAECVDNLVTGCIAIGGDSMPTDGPALKTACKVGNPSHIPGDRYNTFSNMQIINYQGAAFEVLPDSNNALLKDSRISGALTGIKIKPNSNNTALVSTDTFVQNCDFFDVTTLTDIDGGASSIVQGLTIESSRFIRATTGLSPQKASRVRISRNSFIDPAQPATTYAISANAITTFSAKNNDLSGCYRGVKLTACPSARVTGNTLHDLLDTTVYEDAGGNTTALFARNDIFGFTPITRVSGTGPSTGGLIDIGLPYPSDTPTRHSFVEWNYDPVIGGSGSIAVSGSIYVLKVSSLTGGTVNNIMLTVSTAGAGLTAAQNLVGLYDSTGTRIGISGDQSAVWTSTGLKTMALGAAVTIQGGKDYYVAVLSVGTTPPNFIRSGTNVSTPNSGLSSTLQRFSVNGTAQTALPASLTLASNSGVGALTYWTALS